MRLIYFLILGLFFVPSSVLALGVSPGSITMNFQPNFEQEFEFYVINSFDDLEFPIGVYIEGNLDEYIDFEPGNFTLPPGGQEKFTFTLKLPSKMDRPGNHTSNIFAMQSSVVGQGGSGSVGALVAIKVPVMVKVPYEGPYLDAVFHAGDKAVGEIVSFAVLMRSLGTDPVDNYRGTITIFDYNGDEVDEVLFDGSLGLNEERELSVGWDSTGYSAGFYTAHLEIKYDGESYEADTEFRLGAFFIDILDYQKSIKSNEINEYFSTILSTWNAPIQNVYTQIEFNHEGLNKVFKSESFELGAWENKTVKMYIDTEGIDNGKYPATFSVFYGEESNEIEFDLNVTWLSEFVRFIVYSSIVIVLILAWFVFFKKRKLFKLGKRKVH